MIGKEVIIWLDQRWYDAINKHLKDETLEEHLEEVIDQLCNQLPEHEYERISHEIWQEDQENKLAQEAARRFAVFHVTEGHNSTYFVAEENIEMLQVAARLRSYLRKPPENNPTRFAGMFSRGEKISLEQYNTYVQERLENTGRVTGAFDIDLDVGRFDALHIMDGWQCFNTKDVTAAAYFAMKKSGISIDERWKKFLDRLDGKQIMHETEPGFLTGSRMLRPKEICFSEDIVQNGKLLEFCMDGAIDVDQMFGTHTCDYDNGDWFNIYANYDMESHRVCDTLDVYLQHEDGGEQEFKYRLSEEEKALLLPRMDEYCQQRLGQTLEDCSADYLSEVAREPVKYVEGSCRLQPNEIDVEGEVMWSHETLEFYVPVRFDADKVFGSEIATAPRDSYVNVYAYYNLEDQAVCDDLTVLLISDNGSEEEFKYKLTPEEKELFRERMNAVCLKCGADLDECRQEYLQEQYESQSPMMQM